MGRGDALRPALWPELDPGGDDPPGRDDRFRGAAPCRRRQDAVPRLRQPRTAGAAALCLRARAGKYVGAVNRALSRKRYSSENLLQLLLPIREQLVQVLLDGRGGDHVAEQAAGGFEVDAVVKQCSDLAGDELVGVHPFRERSFGLLDRDAFVAFEGRDLLNDLL